MQIFQEAERDSEGGWGLGRVDFRFQKAPFRKEPCTAGAESALGQRRNNTKCVLCLESKREEEKRKEEIRSAIVRKINSVTTGYFEASFPGKMPCS